MAERSRNGDDPRNLTRLIPPEGLWWKSETMKSGYPTQKWCSPKPFSRLKL